MAGIAKKTVTRIQAANTGIKRAPRQRREPRVCVLVATRN